MKKTICFVCWANVCRSPMAEVVFQKMLVQRNLNEYYEAFSAGVSEEKKGEPIETAAVLTLLKHGYVVSARQAWSLSPEDYTRFDYFVAMDMETMWTLRTRFSGDPAHKTGLLMAYTDLPRNIEDPYMSGNYEGVYQEIKKGCGAFLHALLEAE